MPGTISSKEIKHHIGETLKRAPQRIARAKRSAELELERAAELDISGDESDSTQSTEYNF